MTAGKAKPYYASHQVHDFYTKLGNGNRSKGVQVAAAYHGRLVEALRECVHWCPRELTHDARALLAEIEDNSGEMG